MSLSTMNTLSLPVHLDALQIEEKWARLWSDWQIYHYDDTRPRRETFVVDTPPPTVSGSLHVGHVFSYTHTDIIVRYQRMRGHNIFYPMGWDDNGLPTERRVQNYFHVRYDAQVPYLPNLKLEAANLKEQKESPPRIISRANFIELCLQLTHEDEKAFMSLWQRLGLSLDWRQEYSTIGDHCRKTAQMSFIDLYKKGHVYSLEAPFMWDVDFQTAVAQAEIEDRDLPGCLYRLRFGLKDSDEIFSIATTRPELLPACVGITAHPSDERYKKFFGKQAITPLFRVPVPIFPSELVDPEKGTGILMVCTFGDATDVAWWRNNQLPLRQIFGRNGRILSIIYGHEGWKSLNAEAANSFFSKLIGQTLKTARKTILELLRDPSGAAIGSEPPLSEEPKQIEHSVKFFEKGDQPLEFITTRQWFVRLLDKKENLLKAGDQIVWHPDFMRLRYRNWTENLQQDWCISRQRSFGVPFPLWYPLNEHGNPDFANPILAEVKQLPVDPCTTTPPGYSETQRGRPNGFIEEADVFDTWFTSSLTPQICSKWQLDQERHHKLFPMDLRPQSHEIIRTWAFYTIAKALLHENVIPWKQVAISGWVLDPDRKKMSKSKGNVVTPIHLLDQYGSDAVRYWSASARLGTDTAFDENVLKVGKRLATKIFNAGKFVLSQTGEAGPIIAELDKAFLLRLQQMAQIVTKQFEDLDYSNALSETERFFWGNFTDTYLELVKMRTRDDENKSIQGSAIASLRLALSILLRLFAPFLPYVTEEVWSWQFAAETSCKSIHQAKFPSKDEFSHVAEPLDQLSFDVAIQCLSAINKYKTESTVSIARAIENLELIMNKKTSDRLTLVLSDVISAARVANYSIQLDDTLPDHNFIVAKATFVELDKV